MQYINYNCFVTANLRIELFPMEVNIRDIIINRYTTDCGHTNTEALKNVYCLSLQLHIYTLAPRLSLLWLLSAPSGVYAMECTLLFRLSLAKHPVLYSIYTLRYIYSIYHTIQRVLLKKVPASHILQSYASNHCVFKECAQIVSTLIQNVTCKIFKNVICQFSKSNQFLLMVKIDR